MQYKLGSDGDQAYIKAKSFVIGRSPDCDLPIPTDILSRRHVRVILEDDKIMVQDLGSTNGTYLKKQKLLPSEQYEYTTGDRLCLDAGEECSLRITAIYQKEVQPTSSKPTEEPMDPGFEPELTGNMFGNIKFIAQNARFSKERQIKEAENLAQEMMEKAQQDIEKQQKESDAELQERQKKFEEESEKILREANSEAESIVSQAKSQSQEMMKQAQQAVKKANQDAENLLTESINTAQQKQSDIIAEAYLKNKELKTENEKIEQEKSSHQNEIQSLKESITELQQVKAQQEQLAEEAKQQCEQQVGQRDRLNEEVATLEAKNSAALEVLNKEIPGLEKRSEELDKKIKDSKEEIKRKEEDIERVNKLAADVEALKDKHQELAEAAEKRLDELNAKVIEAEDNLLHLTKVKKEKNAEMDQEIAERQEQQKQWEADSKAKIEEERQEAEQEIASRKESQSQLEEESKQNLEKQKNQADEEIRVNLERAQKKAQKLVEKAKEKAEDTIDLAEHDSKQKIEEAQKLAETLIAQANSEAESLKELTQQECAQEKQSAEDYAQGVRDSADDKLNEQRRALEKEMQLEKKALLTKASEEALQITDAARASAQNTIEQAQAKMAQEQKDFNKEIEQRRKDTDQEIHQIRTEAAQAMHKQRLQLDKEEKEKNRINGLRLKKDLNEVLRARMTPFLKDQEQLDKISDMLSRSVNAVLLDEIDSQTVGSDDFFDIDPSLQQNKVKKFYTVAGAVVVVALLLMIYAPTLEKIAKDSERSIASNIEKQDQAQIEAAQKAHDLSSKFEPEMQSEYFASYTERIMYTENYMSLENDTGFREQWRLDLEDFFVDELRLNENDMVPFFAREAALIEELVEARSSINGNFVDEGKARLQEIEADFYKRLEQGGLKKAQVDRIMKFKKELDRKSVV